MNDDVKNEKTYHFGGLVRWEAQVSEQVYAFYDPGSEVSCTEGACDCSVNTGCCGS